MEFVKLGSTNTEISRLAFGCAPASGYDYGALDEAAWVAAVHAALENGINFFDVADVYGFGKAEELLSLALDKKRHEVIIATKGGLLWDETGRVRRNSKPPQIRCAVENSLRRLRLDIIPLYQLHWPDPATPVEETFAELAKLQREGKIHSVGTSNFPVELLERASRVCRIDSEQISYNLLSRESEADTLPWCNRHHASVLAHTALARGLLAGKRSIGSRFDGTDTRSRSPYFSAEGVQEKQRLLKALSLLGRKYGRPVAGVALRWLLDNPKVAAILVGIRNRIQLEENLEAVDWHLDTVDRILLANLSGRCPRGLAGLPAHRNTGIS